MLRRQRHQSLCRNFGRRRLSIDQQRHKLDRSQFRLDEYCCSGSCRQRHQSLCRTRYGGVFRSTNNGTSWTEVNSGLTHTDVRALAVSGANLFAGTNGVVVFRSINNGTSWTEVNSGLTNTDVIALAVSGTNLFAGTHGGIFLSTNNGTSWSYSGLTNTFVYALAVSGTNLFAGIDRFGVFLSTNSGTSWLAVNSGLTNTDVQSLAVSGTNLFAGIYGGGVWRRPLSEMITSVEQLSSGLPVHFRLQQNYPNPFNPSTTISYQIPEASNVTLIVYDILGKEAAKLVNGEKNAGTYNAQFSTDNFQLSSGIYFYRLEALSKVSSKHYTEVGKMVLLR